MIWGPELYQDDFPILVKKTFESRFRRGCNVPELTTNIVACFSVERKIHNHEMLLWITLADIQWNLGVLTEEVAQQALSWINNGGDLDFWRQMHPELVPQRKRMLYSIKHKLMSNRKPVVNPKSNRLYKCNWDIGDTYAIKCKSLFSKEKGLDGKYIVLRKIAETVWYPGHIVPIILSKITNDDILPRSEFEYEKLDYIQIRAVDYAARYLPIDGRNPQKDIAEKENFSYVMDRYGFLPEYRAILLNTSLKKIPSDLSFVGNYKSASFPSDEFVAPTDINLTAISWGADGLQFESTILERYCFHNLRELSIYQ